GDARKPQVLAQFYSSGAPPAAATVISSNTFPLIVSCLISVSFQEVYAIPPVFMRFPGGNTVIFGELAKTLLPILVREPRGVALKNRVP
ncbi:MAG: hypothetical protein J6V01_01800, partial [Clostridia bacterium]|nr:hypothetical protein [Clostridia bacterium]